MATKSERGSTADKSQMSESRRERLLDIQRREQLKGMLTHKFKLKYGDRPNISKYIDNEVNKFLKNDRLTEENLKRLDDKICKETELRERKDEILDDHRSQKSRASSQRPSTQGSRRGAPIAAADNFDTRSQRSQKSVASSRMSGASKLSKPSQAAAKQAGPGLGVSGKNFDGLSMASSKAPLTEVYSEIDEEDEWTAIQKFNTLLHYEEQKQALLRDKERKRLIKQELDKQLREKQGRKKKEQEEANMYETLQEQHIRLLEQREKEKHEEMKRKIMQEKESRDKQLMEEKHRKKYEEREQMKQEVDLVRRLQSEMEQERNVLLEKRRQEKEYLQKMLVENEKQKVKSMEEREKERQEDIRAQKEYSRMLEKQEQDRHNEFKAREKRAQEFMNKMADTVIRQMDDRQKEEDDKIRRYEMEKEMRERMEDERRFMRTKAEQAEMRAFLNK